MISTLIQMDATALAETIAKGDASSLEVVQAHMTRMKQVNPTLNAMVAERFDVACDEARAADVYRRSGAPLPLLHGVPFTVKDSLDLQGLPSTFGLLSRAGHRATADEPHVARLRAAGGIALAKSNVAQSLMYYESDNPLHGRSQNPWNVQRTPGGSSGGEAALIAAGASPLGVATDIAGSLRVPAAFCGIASIKPTSGRCDDLGRFSVPLGQRAVPSQVGVMARSVRDVALGLQIINGGSNPEVLPPRPLLDWRRVDVRQLRVGFYTDDGTFEVSPAVARAVREAADALRAGGAQVRPWIPPDARHGLNLLYGILGGDALKLMVQRMGPGKTAPQIRQLAAVASLPRSVVLMAQVLLRGLGQSGLAAGLDAFGFSKTSHYWELLEAQLDYRLRFAQAMDDAPGGAVDVILCPPCALPAFTHGASTDLLTAGAYACLYNLLGYPAGVVPVSRVQVAEQTCRTASLDRITRVAIRVEQGSVGLPVGVQVVARPWREDLVLASMGAIEAVAGRQPMYPWEPIR